MSAKEKLMHLPLEKILPNPQQPRKKFKEETIQGLAQSIRTQGIIQPLVVRVSLNFPGNFELVAGERRWRALQLTDITEIPVILKEVSDQDLLEVALLENIQRENLTPIEEATCYQELMDRHHYTQDELARRVGKNRSTITNLMRLLQLPSAIQNDLEEGRLTVGHARALLALPSVAEQLHLRETLLKQQWSVRETEKQIHLRAAQLKALIDTKQPFSRNLPNDVNIQLMTLETELQRHFGTKVSLHYRKGKGYIKIEYYSLDEFERIYALLLEKRSTL